MYATVVVFSCTLAALLTALVIRECRKAYAGFSTLFLTILGLVAFEANLHLVLTGIKLTAYILAYMCQWLLSCIETSEFLLQVMDGY